MPVFVYFILAYSIYSVMLMLMQFILIRVLNADEVLVMEFTGL